MIIIYLALVVIGFLNIYAAVYNPELNTDFAVGTRYFKQMIWIIAAFFLALCIIIIDPTFFKQTSYVIYWIFIIMLFAVLVIGSTTKGAKSWFGIGDFGIQPSEFAKAATALALAKFLSRTDFTKDLKTILVTLSIIALPTCLILLQNDTGSAIVFLAFGLTLYREGMSKYILLMVLAMIILFILSVIVNFWWIVIATAFITLLVYWKRRLFWRHKVKLRYFVIAFGIVVAFVGLSKFAYDNVLQQHQRDRIDVLLGIKQDNRGIGYNVYQSKIAIGSGGLFGKGFLNGTQTKYNFVPEQDTDFIFCTIGEEWGLIGSSVTLLLYLALLVRIIHRSERQRSNFSRLYGYSVASILFFHVLINIGMTLGLLPVIGIPLPFISYGGSSLWAFTFLLFIFIRQDAKSMDIV
jgi:rod shape determining protein RodA